MQEMLALILAGILSLPGMLLLVLTALVTAVLSLPALTLLVFRKPAAVVSSSGANKKQVIITGGSSGIGLALAKECAARSDVSSITILARNKEQLTRAQKEIQAVNAKVAVNAISVDVSDNQAINDVASKCFAASSKASSSSSEEDPLQAQTSTHVFCCAGVAHPGYFEQFDTTAFTNMIQVNQLGSIYTARAFVPRMSSGTITFCSSMAGQLGVFGFSAYSPTKFAIRGFAECLHMELSNKPIHVQVAYPPDTETPGYEKENTLKPEETRLISETAGLQQPGQVARVMVRGAFCKNPKFALYFNLEGWMVSKLTAGFSPVPNLLDAICQVALVSLLRWVSLFYLKDWHRIIRNYQNKESSTDSTKHKESSAAPLENKASSSMSADTAVSDK